MADARSKYINGKGGPSGPLSRSTPRCFGNSPRLPSSPVAEMGGRFWLSPRRESDGGIVRGVQGGERLHRSPPPHVRLVEEVAVALAAQELVLDAALFGEDPRVGLAVGVVLGG